MRTVKRYLNDMLDHIHYLESFAVTHVTMLYDIRTQFAVRKAYEIIGEIVKRLPDEVLGQQPHIPWKGLKGMRDILTHRYHDVDLGLLWDALQQLDELKQAVEYLVQHTPED